MTRSRNGFTVLELVIVTAVLGIVAAVVVPALVRTRVAANESATLGDVRTLMSAQAAYRTANGGFYERNLGCLLSPSTSGCIPAYPTNGPTFLDSQLASLSVKAGYNRLFFPGPTPVVLPPTVSPSSTTRYRYDATPIVFGLTGVRGFAGDYTERICWSADGTPVPAGATHGELPPNCQALR